MRDLLQVARGVVFLFNEQRGVVACQIFVKELSVRMVYSVRGGARVGSAAALGRVTYD